MGSSENVKDLKEIYLLKLKEFNHKRSLKDGLRHKNSINISRLLVSSGKTSDINSKLTPLFNDLYNKSVELHEMLGSEPVKENQLLDIFTSKDSVGIDVDLESTLNPISIKTLKEEYREIFIQKRAEYECIFKPLKLSQSLNLTDVDRDMEGECIEDLRQSDDQGQTRELEGTGAVEQQIDQDGNRLNTSQNILTEVYHRYEAVFHSSQEDASIDIQNLSDDTETIQNSSTEQDVLVGSVTLNDSTIDVKDVKTGTQGSSQVLERALDVEMNAGVVKDTSDSKDALVISNDISQIQHSNDTAQTVPLQITDVTLQTVSVLDLSSNLQIEDIFNRRFKKMSKGDSDWVNSVTFSKTLAKLQALVKQDLLCKPTRYSKLDNNSGFLVSARNILTRDSLQD